MQQLPTAEEARRWRADAHDDLCARVKTVGDSFAAALINRFALVIEEVARLGAYSVMLAHTEVDQHGLKNFGDRAEALRLGSAKVANTLTAAGYKVEVTPVETCHSQEWASADPAADLPARLKIRVDWL